VCPIPERTDMIAIQIILASIIGLCVYMRGGHEILGTKLRRSICVALVGMSAVGYGYLAGLDWWLLVIAAGVAGTFTLGHGGVLGFLDRGVDGRASGWQPFMTGALTGLAFVLPLAGGLLLFNYPAGALLLLAGFLKPFCYGLAGMTNMVAPFPDRDAVAGALHGATVSLALIIGSVA
jgi:hypothetical protein